MHHHWERLARGVHRCRIPFCDVTIGLVHGYTGALLIDTGTTIEEARTIRADVRQMTRCPVTHVVLTHKHFDHVLGSSVFADAEIYCAPEVVEYLSSSTDQIRHEAIGYGATPEQVDRAIAALQPPRYGTFRSVIDLGGRTATIAYLGAGHTRSDVVVVVTADRNSGPTVVFTGDLVEESADPAIDADSDLVAWPTTLDRLLDIAGPDAVFVPGHGSVVDAEFVRRQQNWLRVRAADLLQ